MSTPRALPLVEPTEQEFTDQVIRLARLYRWRVLHMRPAMTRGGRWATHVQGDGVGFPDLLMLRDRRAVAAELKVGRNKTTPEQEAWLCALSAADIPAYVWHPGDWDEILATLAPDKAIA